MEFSQLRYFVAVAHGESMRKTAESLHVAQTTLSMSIKKLEDELGVSLFDRYSNSFRLTTVGAMFLQKASKLLLDADAIWQETVTLGRQEKNMINIGVGATGLTIESSLVYRALHPEINFKFLREWARPASALLFSHQAELCTSFFPVDSMDVVSQPLINEPMFAMVAKSNPLSSRTSFTLQELADHPILTTLPGSDFRELTEHLFACAGVKPHEYVEAGDQETHFHYVRHDLGIGFVPETTANMMHAGREFSAANIAVIPLSEPFCRRNVYVSYLKERTLTPILSDYYSFLVKFCSMAAERKILPEKKDIINVAYSS